MTLTEFLLARITEDEVVAQATMFKDGWSAVRDEASWWVADASVGALYSTGYVGNGDSRPAANHIARHDPSRVLAECAAKRTIVQIHGVTRDGLSCSNCSYKHTEAWVPYPCDTVRALGAPFASHADFDPSWGTP